MIKLVKKDLKLFFKDKRAMMLTFAMPIILITLFAYVFNGAGKDKKHSKAYDLIVSDLDHTISSKNAIGRLNSQKIIHVIPEQLEMAQEAIRKGKNGAVLIFHKGFSDSIIHGNHLPIELQYDESQEIQVGMLQQALLSTLTRFPFMTEPTILKSLNKGTISNPDPRTGSNFDMVTEIKMTKLVTSKDDNTLGLVQAVAGTAIMMLLFSVGGMGASLLDEKQEGTLKKLLYSPMSSNNILFGKMAYVNIIAIIQLSIMFVYAQLMFGLDSLNHFPTLFFMILGTAFACSSFGIFLASFAKSRQQVQGLATLIGLIMSCIGGSMVPYYMMPALMQKFSVFSVNYWGIQGFYDIFWRHLSLTDPTFLTRILVLVFIGTILNFSALQLYRKNILKLA